LIVSFLVAGVMSGPLDWPAMLSSAVWDPARNSFGAVAMIWGTAAVAALALLIAAPVGWAAAIAISELAPRRCKAVSRSACEVLAVVPSIVYGLIGVVYVRPFVSRLGDVPGGDSLLAAGLVLAVMVLPTIIALSVDALNATPAGVREAAAACGLKRSEVIRDAVLPFVKSGFRAAALLGLARALGETVAVYLVVGRADGRIPRSPGDVLERLIHPGQTLTTKLNGPESLLAGTSGAHWAAMCALGVLLLAAVATLTIVGQRGGPTEERQRGLNHAAHRKLHGSGRARVGIDRLLRWGLGAFLVLPLLAAVAVVLVVVTRGTVALHPGFWWSASVGADGGGIRNQLVGTALLVVVAGVLTAPVGLGLGLLVADHPSAKVARWLRTAALTLGGVPSILLGLWGYWFFSIRLGLGKSWLAGAVVLAIVALPPVVIAVASAAATVPANRREAALAVGLRPNQLVRSVVLPQAVPGLITGLLLGLARAAGETAPLLFTATVFNGASTWPRGIDHAPITSLPTHIFVLAQDSVQPGAIRAAWGAALALVIVAGALVLAAIPARRRMERSAA
jgi:phosphate transport system permease protein